jgi:hypothetical protein
VWSLVALVVGLLAAAPAAPGAFTRDELAAHRLTAPVFERFQDASRRVAAVVRDNERYTAAPLFTREVILADDVVVAAAELRRRLDDDPALVAAVSRADMTTREFTVFALALVAARLAHGFVEAGVLRGIPAGVASDNVAFVGEHQREIATVLSALGIVV